MGSEDKIKIGIVGMGGMGSLYYRCFQMLPGCGVTAVVSKRPFEGSVEVFQSLSDLLDKADIDVVCVCTPSFMHAEQVRTALIRGKHVICEKPLTLDSEEAGELFDLAKGNGVGLFPAHVVRFSDSSVWLKDILKDQRFGKVREVFMSRLSPCPSWNRNLWSYDKEKSGHVPYDLHIHDLDLMVSLFGAPQQCDSLQAGNPDLPFAEHWWFRYSYPEFDVIAEASWYRAPYPFTATWRVNFDDALAVCVNGTVTVYQEGKEPWTVEEKLPDAVESGFSVPASTMYTNELKAFTDCIRNNGELPVSKEDVMCVLRILEGSI